MNESIKILLKKEFILLLVFGLILVDFLTKGMYWCYLILPYVFLLVFKNKHLIDRNLIWIVLFSFLYTSLLFFKGIFTDVANSLILGYLLFPGSFYFIGKYLGERFPNEDSFLFFQFFIATLFSLIPFVSNLIHTVNFGFMTTRRILLIGRDVYMSATNIGAHFALNLSLLALVFTIPVNSFERSLKYISLVLFVTGFFSTLNLINRTGLFIVIISFFTILLVSSKSLEKGKLLLFLALPILLVVLFNLGNIVSWFKDSFYFYRLTAIIAEDNDDKSRIVRWLETIQILMKHPLGIREIDFHYAHNFWLDVAKKTGYLGLIPLTIFSINFIKSVYRVFFRSRVSFFAKNVVLAFSVGYLLTFLVEPIMEGYIIMFFFFCFFFGQVKSLENLFVD